MVPSVGGRGSSIAVRAGGKGDVTKTHVVWSGSDRARISTPIVHDGRLYWINSRVVNCVDAKTGKRVYQSRLSAPSAAGGGEGRSEDRRRGFGGGGGFGRGTDYSSPVVADGKLYYFSRSGDGFVLRLGKEFEQLALNRLGSDGGDFSATPAISRGELFVRSSTHLYCVATSAKSGTKKEH